MKDHSWCSGNLQREFPVKTKIVSKLVRDGISAPTQFPVLTDEAPLLTSDGTEPSFLSQK